MRVAAAEHVGQDVTEWFSDSCPAQERERSSCHDTMIYDDDFCHDDQDNTKYV